MPKFEKLVKEVQPMQAVEAAEYSDGETDVEVIEEETQTEEEVQSKPTGFQQPVDEETEEVIVDETEEIEPEIEEVLEDITDESIEQKEEGKPEEPEKEEVKKPEYQPIAKGAPDIQKLFESPVESYDWNQFQQDAFDEKGEPKKGGIYEAAFAKYNRAEAQKGARAETQRTQTETKLFKIAKDYPDLWQNSGNDFINSLNNTSYYDIDDFFHMFLEKTGQRPVSSGMARSIQRVDKNLHRRKSVSAVTGKVVKKVISKKSEEILQAEQDTGEDLSLPDSF